MHFEPARARKTPPKKMSIVLPLLQGKPAVFEPCSLVWGAKFTKKNPPERRWPNRSRSKCVELNAKRGEFYWECPEDSYGPLPMGTKLMAYPIAPFRRTSSHRSWEQCGVVTVRGGRSDSKAVLSRVFNPAHLGIDFLIEILSKSHLGQPPPHTSSTSNQHTLFP